MALSVEVRGAFQFGRVAKRVREAGRKDLDRKMHRGIEDAVGPLKVQVSRALAAAVPDIYAAVVVPALDLKTRTQSRGDGTGVRIECLAKGKVENRDVRALDKGILRHPLFGDRDRWYAQPVKPGFFTATMRDGAPVVRQRLVEQLDELMRELGG